MYNSIYNLPLERASNFYSDVFWDNAFTPHELTQLNTFCDNLKLETATTVGTTDKKLLKKIRKSNVKFFPRNEETGWIYDRFNNVIHLANQRFYGFDLNGYSTIQYTTYTDKDKGFYGWHTDMHMNRTDENIYSEPMHRKLSMTFLLNDDFEGGDFEIITGDPKKPKEVNAKLGRAIFFPSFMLHRVKPVTKGIRKSIVIWVLGPKFK